MKKTESVTVWLCVCMQRPIYAIWKYVCDLYRHTKPMKNANKKLIKSNGVRERARAIVVVITIINNIESEKKQQEPQYN